MVRWIAALAGAGLGTGTAIWLRVVVRSLGEAAAAPGLFVALLLAGTAGGAWLAGRIGRHQLRVSACAMASVAVLALGSPGAAAGGVPPPVAVALAVLVGVAAGMVLALLAARAGSGRGTACVGAALLGAGVGVAGAGLLLLPRLGERAGLALAGAMLLVGAGAAWIGERLRPVETAGGPEPSRSRGPGFSGFAAVGAGATAVACSSLRLAAAAWGGSLAVSAAVTAVFLTLAGAAAVTAKGWWREPAWRWLSAIAAGSAPLAAMAPGLVIPALGSQRLFLAVLAGFAAAWWWWRRTSSGIVLVAVAVVLLATPAEWLPAHLAGGDVEALRETVAGTVSIEAGARGTPTRRELVLDGAVLAGDTRGSRAHRALLGHLPMLLHPSPRRVLLIGLGSSATASALAEEKPERLQVVEPSGTLLDLAQAFDGGDGAWRRLAGLELHAGGLATPSLRAGAGWDVIVLDRVHPGLFGGGAQLTLEYLAACRGALATTGVLALRMPLDTVNDESMSVALRALWDVLPGVAIWYAAAVPEPTIVVTATADVGRLRPRWDALLPPRLSASLAGAGITDPAALATALLIAPPGVAYLVEGESAHEQELPIVEREATSGRVGAVAMLRNLRSLYTARARSDPFADLPVPWNGVATARDERIKAQLRTLGQSSAAR